MGRRKDEVADNNNNHNKSCTLFLPRPWQPWPLAPCSLLLAVAAATASGVANWAPLAPIWLCSPALVPIAPILLVILRFSFPQVVGTVRVCKSRVPCHDQTGLWGTCQAM